MLITDQVATAPCTDRIQVRFSLLRQSHLYMLLYLRSYELAAAALEVRHVPRIIGTKTAFNTSGPIEDD